MLKKATLFCLFFTLALFLTGCDRSRLDKGREYFPDMAYGLAYRTWSENPAMEDGKTMRLPVEGTVPTHMVPYPFPLDFEGREMAARQLRNPLEDHPGLIEQGQQLYNIFCSNCHGVQGDGQGNLFTTGRYIIPPATLLSPELMDAPEGEMYHVITAGWGVMGPHGHLILPQDRWKIIRFIEVVFHEKENL